MATDSIFLQGHSHQVCQDYAQNEGPGFIFVGDGCSSANRSDLAARLLFLAALQTFREFTKTTPALVQAAALQAADLGNAIEFGTEVPLYATMLTARRFGNRVLVQALGDGAFLVGNRDGTVRYIKLSFPRYNAPFYPVYAIDAAARNAWIEEFSENHFHIETKTLFQNGQGKAEKDELLQQSTLTGVPWFTLELDATNPDLQFLILLSDGIGTFTANDGREVDDVRIIQELCAFKNLSGEFLKRRVLRMKADFQKAGISHQDDFSAAVMTFP